MKRTLLATALCAALAGGTIPATQAAGDGGPLAAAAKKGKCGKKGKASAARKGKCKKRKSGVAQATALFAGSAFGATGCTSTMNCNRSYTYALAFCRNGTYSARFELNDSITGNTFVDRFGGTWKFKSASAKTGAGVLGYTIDQWSSDAGSPQPARDQQSQVQAQSATSFVIDGTNYTRTPGGAGC